MRKVFTNRQAGFSLVELMIVVGIIGLLATLAVPRFQQFQAKARMAEAKNMLNHIYTLQESYHLDTNVYIAFPTYGRLAAGTSDCVNTGEGSATIGFEISPCNTVVPRYGYSAVAGATGLNDSFTASATTGAAANNLVCPGDAAHTFTINQLRTTTGPTGC
jgi:prepilin-type N-terminal cleavage/methylation domain-containing protein